MTVTGNRIEWIDAMRGFSMMLVVFGHVLMSMGIGGEKTFLSSFLMTFRMPLFFFVSGFFSYRATTWWNKKRIQDILGRKFKAQVLATIIFLTVFQIAFNLDIGFAHGFGYYWYTIVLFQMYMVYLVFSCISRVVKKNIADGAMVAISLAGIIIAVRLPDIQISQILSWSNFFHYFQFFTFGILCSKYKNGFFRLVDNDRIKAAVITLCVSGCLLWIGGVKFFVFNYINRYILCKYFTLLVVIIYFHGNAELYSRDSKVSKVMKYIGKRTLDIYFLHFFFLPDLGFMRDFLLDGNMIVIQVLAASIITSVILAFTCLISSILRQSDTLGTFLFGLKKQAPQHS